MKRSKVETLAKELMSVFDADAKDKSENDAFRRLARHVLAREKRARGRTVGYVGVRYYADYAPRLRCTAKRVELTGIVPTEDRARRLCEHSQDRVARVSLLPKRKVSK